MRVTYYSGGAGELFITGEEPIRIAEIEEASLILDYTVRAMGSDRDDFPTGFVAGPGTGSVSCLVRVLVEGNPLVDPGKARLFKRAERFTVPNEEPFRLVLPDEPVPETLVVETTEGDAFRVSGIPSPGHFSWKPGEKALYFSRSDAGKDVLLSYAYGETISESWCQRELGLILVFPVLGRSPSGDPSFRVIEARRAVLSSWSEEFVSGKETLARASFVLLSDEEGFIIREGIVGPET